MIGRLIVFFLGGDGKFSRAFAIAFAISFKEGMSLVSFPPEPILINYPSPGLKAQSLGLLGLAPTDL